MRKPHLPPRRGSGNCWGAPSTPARETARGTPSTRAGRAATGGPCPHDAGDSTLGASCDGDRTRRTGCAAAECAMPLLRCGVEVAMEPLPPASPPGRRDVEDAAVTSRREGTPGIPHRRTLTPAGRGAPRASTEADTSPSRGVRPPPVASRRGQERRHHHRGGRGGRGGALVRRPAILSAEFEKREKQISKGYLFHFCDLL
jgi:hypothetical protein